jgi:hypothetical protein
VLLCSDAVVFRFRGLAIPNSWHCIAGPAEQKSAGWRAVELHPLRLSRRTVTTVDLYGMIAGGAHLSIGPTFECPASLVQQLPVLASSQNIRVNIVHHTEPDARTVYCVFKAAFGRIDGHLNVKEAILRLWLTFPRAYALNPLLWPLSFHLIRKVERLPLSNNARSCVGKPTLRSRGC